MNFKYKFDMPAVFAMIVGTLVLVVVGYIMRKLGMPYVQETEAIMIVIIAAVFGASAGGITTVTASILFYVMLHVNVDVIYMIAFILLAIAIGHYASDFRIREGGFRSGEVIRFCLGHFLLEGLIWMFFIPFFSFLTQRSDLFAMLRKNTDSLIFTILADVVLAPAFYLISLIVRNWQERKKNAQKLGLTGH